MKKLIAFVVLLGLSNYVQAQFGDCTYCSGNEVNNDASAIGESNASLGEFSFASGMGNRAIGKYSHAFGLKNQTTNWESFAAGYSNTSSGVASICLGSTCTATGKGAFAAGVNTTAIGFASFALGHNVRTSGSTYNSFVFGSGVSDKKLLENSVPNSLMIGFFSTYPTFFVSPSEGEFKTGRIGIGDITEPEAKLHIKADNNEDAAIMLEPTGTDYLGRILFGDENHSISGRENNAMVFKSGMFEGFSFEGGSINMINGHVASSKIEAIDGEGLRLTDQYGHGGLLVADGGNVGIGTANPYTEFQIGDYWTFNKHTNYLDIGYNVKNTNVGGYSGIGRIIEDEACVMKLSATGNIVFQTAGTGSVDEFIDWNYPLTISSEGRVGIWNTSPQNARLEIVQNLHDEYALKLYNYSSSENNSNTFWIQHQSNNVNDNIIRVTTGSTTPIFHIKGDGNVGIGTATPDAKLRIQAENGNGLWVRTYQSDKSGIVSDVVNDGTKAYSVKNTSDRFIVYGNGKTVISIILVS